MQLRDSDARFNGSMHWKRISGREYLYRSYSGGKNQSLGPRSAETEAIKQRFEAGSAEHKTRTRELVEKVKIHAGYIKVNRLNRFPKAGARVIRSFQQAEIPHRVIGTNAIYAYEISAGVLFMPEHLATEDMDLLMDDRQSLKITAKLGKRTLLSLIKKTDKTFKRLTDSPYEFAAVNSKGYRVELITQGAREPIQPSEFNRLLQAGDLRPIGIDSLKWHIASPRYSEVVFDEQGMPLKIDTVDPRAFVLHKVYVSKKADRRPAKRRRDEQHARIVAMLIARELKHLPESPAIAKLFPEALVRQAPYDPDQFSV